MVITKYKAAAVTSEPAWFDLNGAVEKTIKFIREANDSGCKLVAFPEVWIPGYPYWMWKVTYQQSLPLLKKYRENALPVDSDHMRRIRAAARDNHIPHVEKLVYGDGAADTFHPITTTELGRIGQLNCWENMNPFLKALSVSLGEQVHIAAWPVYPDATTLKYPDPATNVADPASDLVTPAYAIETGAWTLAPFQRLSVEGLRVNTPEGVEPETDPSVYNGHARIFAPDGRCVARPDRDFDGLLFVDIDLNESHLTKALADFGGHYMRPDLIRLLVDTGRKELVTEVDGNGEIKKYSTRERLGLNRPLDEEEEPEGVQNAH